MIDTDLWNQNRALLAERLKWPKSALGVCEAIEKMFEDYAVYWSTGPADDRKEGFYARRHADDRAPTIYGRVADELIQGIQRDIARVAADRAERARMSSWW